MTPAQKVDWFAHFCSARLNEIAAQLAEGLEITLVVRNPDSEESEWIMSHDDLDAVIAVLQRGKLRAKEARGRMQ